MPRFEFRLRSLLAVREAERAAARTHLAAAQVELEELVATRALRQRGLDEQRSWLRNRAAPGQIDPQRLAAASRYERVLLHELEALFAQQQALEVETERRRAFVVEADREVRVLEKLRERKFEQYQRDQALAEVKRFDEVASQARIRAADEMV
jgi:flagellar export protein FliJ